MAAIDFHGTPAAMKLDLNGPIDLERQFDIVMNLGTVEHVFNVAQAMKTIHDHTRPGGLMMHGMPLSGWVDHGFYSFNATFYWDLAAANGYDIDLALYTELNPLKLVRLKDREDVLAMAKDAKIGANALIYMILRRPAEARPFQIPMQGYYAGSISTDAAVAWKALR
jgi:SAM-dependent methyltransferase